MTFKVTYGFAFLFCKEEGWQAMTGTRLLKAQRDDHQELLPASSHL